MKQQTLAMAADQGFERHRKPSRRDAFVETMNRVVPWDALCAVVEPHYPKKGNGRPPIGLERMLRIHFLQHWFNLADPACEEAVYDSASLRRFAGIDLGSEPVPDATTLLKFRRLLEQHKLAERLFAEVGRVLQDSGMTLKTGTIVDAAIIATPSSTSNADRQRDPAMHQTRKGKQWCVTNTGLAVVLHCRWEKASQSRLAGAGLKSPGAAAFKRRGGERPRKSHPLRWQVSIEKMSESKPSDDASLLPQDTVKTGVDHWLQDQSGRYLFTGPMTVGV